MSERTLIVLAVSPWSERARWAFDHHRLPYRTREHAPFIGERTLRRLAGKKTGRVTVPVLLEGTLRLTDSWDIARHADQLGSADKLFPPGSDPEVRRWNDLADQSAAAGRALISAALLASPEALEETLPPQVPSFLRPLLRPVTRYGTRWFARKYGLNLDDRHGAEQGMRVGFDALREQLSRSTPYLLGSRFSYADIAMSTLLQGIHPVEHPCYPIGPATRRTWISPTLTAAYPDLIAWRDEIYRRHRSAGA